MSRAVNGEFALEFVELGEGMSGDFNPDDPDDVELLRVDVYRNGEQVDSYCTMCRVGLSEVERQAILDRWVVHLTHADWKAVIQRLTWEENVPGPKRGALRQLFYGPERVLVICTLLGSFLIGVAIGAWQV